MDLAGQKAYYDERWAREDSANVFEALRADAIFERIARTGLVAPRILDLGCGRGWLAGALCELGPTTGVDLSDLAAARARWPAVEFVTADLFQHPLPEAAFDLVVSQEVIEHVEDQPRYLDVAARCLKPGGYLVLTTPNAWVQARRTRRELEAWGLQPVEKWLSRRALRRLLRVRFELLDTTTLIPGAGSRGSLLFWNSKKVRGLLAAIGLGGTFDRLRCRLGMGLHLIALARRR
ncbi:MAG: class I SAM-dependent methyltransferase [Planctomycetaceae bacterium]